MEAAKDADMWTYTSASYRFVFGPCEEVRRWGLCCSCPEHVRARVEDTVLHIACCWNGRRLAEVPDKMKKEDEADLYIGQNIKPQDCDNHEFIFKWILVQIHKKMGEAKIRIAYLGLVPWRFCVSDTVAGAAECLQQVRSKPLEAHDPVTRMAMGIVGGDMERRANGEDASLALVDEATAWRCCSLVEDGEGYHRETHQEKVRAPASTARHLKQCTRTIRSLANVRAFCIRYGRRGRQVVRHDWRTWKRIVQKPGKRRWYPVKAGANAVLNQIHRQDEKGACSFFL
jgi:hypothetical protein